MVAAATLALAACGGANDNQKTAPAATATTAAETTSTAVDVAADKAKARTLVLAASDLPSGWKATSHQDDPSEQALQDEFATCIGRPTQSSYVTASANSPDFGKGDAQVNSEVQIVKTTADFDADVAATRSAKFMPCYKRQLTKSLQQVTGATVRSITVTQLPVASHGEFSAGYRATIRLEAQGQTVTMYGDDILLGKDRMQLTASFFDVQRPPDTALENAVVDKLAAKLDAA
jgi:hypothetical protein